MDAIAATDAPIQNFSLGAGEYGENDELALDEYRAVAEFQAELINSELAEISARIKSLNPELYNQMQSKPPMEQLYAYRSWVAHESFDWYKIRLIEDIKLKSANTGRHIKTANGKIKTGFFKILLSWITTLRQIVRMIYVSFGWTGENMIRLNAMLQMVFVKQAYANMH